jgi:ferredoxin
LERQGLGLDPSLGEIRINPALSVDSGICSSVCPSGILRFQHLEQRLTFAAAHCLVYEQCLHSCPLVAISLVLQPK